MTIRGRVCYYVCVRVYVLTKDHHGGKHLGWLRGTVVERWSVTGELSLSHARPAADG